MFKSFTLIGAENLKPIDYGAGVLSFFIVACGGALIGLIAAFIVSFVTKWVLLKLYNKDGLNSLCGCVAQKDAISDFFMCFLHFI